MSTHPTTLFSDVTLRTVLSSSSSSSLHNDGSNDEQCYHHHNNDLFFKFLSDMMKITSSDRFSIVTNLNVKYLRTAVRVKRRTGRELLNIDEVYKKDWLINWLAVKSFGLEAFRCIKYDSFKKDRNIVMAGAEKDGMVLFECTIPKEILEQDDELILKALPTRLSVLKLANSRIRNDPSILKPLLTKDGMLLEFCGDSLKSDREIIEIAIKQNINSCQFIPPNLLNEDLVLNLVQKNGLLLNHFPQYNSNVTIVKAAVLSNANSLCYASKELKSDEEIVMLAFSKQIDTLVHASPELFTNESFMNRVMDLVQTQYTLPNTVQDILQKHCGESSARYREFLLVRFERGIETPTTAHQLKLDDWIRILSRNTYQFNTYERIGLSGGFKNLDLLIPIARNWNIDVITNENMNYLDVQRAMIKKHPDLLRKFDTTHRSNVSFLIELVEESSTDITWYCGEELIMKNRKLLLALVKKHSYSSAWSYCKTFDEELFEIGLEACSYNFIEYLNRTCKDLNYFKRVIEKHPRFCIQSNELVNNQNNVTIVQSAATTSVGSDRIERLSDEQKKDKELIIKTLKESPMSFPYVDPSLKDDRQVMMAALSKHGGALKLFNAEYKKDKEMVMASKHQGIMYADKSMLRDRDVILNAAQHFGGILELLDKDLRNDREIVLQCIKTTPMSLEFASETLRNDREIVKIAYQLNPSVLEFSDLSLVSL